jgi:hypothetical protein
MKNITGAFLLLLVPSLAAAQVSLRVELGVPLPPAPTLVVVQPGIQVVAGYPEEVFLTNGHYWLRRDGGWYRSVHPTAGFVVVPSSRVPPGLARLPPGHYRNYGKAQAKADREASKAHRKAAKQASRADHDH